MANVEFGEDTQFGARPEFAAGRKGLTDWLVRNGIAADEKKANSILVVTVIIFAVASVFFFVRFSKDRPPLTERDYQLTPPPGTPSEAQEL